MCSETRHISQSNRQRNDGIGDGDLTSVHMDFVDWPTILLRVATGLALNPVPIDFLCSRPSFCAGRGFCAKPLEGDGMSEEPRKRSRAWLSRTLAALVVLASYETVHYATVRPVWEMGTDGICRHRDLHALGYKEAPEWVERFFGPAEFIDAIGIWGTSVCAALKDGGTGWRFFTRSPDTGLFRG
jgi:hypothetical protein